MQVRPMITQPPTAFEGSYKIPSSFAKKINDIPPPQHPFYEGLQKTIGNVFGFMGAYVPFCCCCPSPFRSVPQGNAGIIHYFGKAIRVVDPGLHFINPNTDHLLLVPTSITITDIPQQTIMTRDNVNVVIDSVVYWHIVDPFVAKCHVVDVEMALRERTQTTLRDTLGSRELQSLISEREELAKAITYTIEETAISWGVAVESILIKDLHFNNHLIEDLSAVAKQQRIGESKVIAARAEVESARLMREASDILNSTAAMQIRYLETLALMSKTSNAKIIFLPTDDPADELIKKMVMNSI